MEQSEDWLTGHRYLNMEVLEEKPLIVDAAQLVAEPVISS